MPELPEVETVCRGLSEKLIGAKIEKILVRKDSLRVKVPANIEKLIAGAKVTKINRRAKYILVYLDNSQVLILHLGMSGSAILHDKTPTEYRKHDHVIIWFNNTVLIFHDPRRFGLVTVANINELEQHKLFASLGIEPLDIKATGDYLYKILQSSKAPIKSVIMDQSRIVGVGNIYASEALFRSHIHPEKPANEIGLQHAQKLMTNIKDILTEAINAGGSTLRDYVNSLGDSGDFQNHFSVYGKSGKPCPNCKTPISQIKQAGRSTFFCQKCQK